MAKRRQLNVGYSEAAVELVAAANVMRHMLAHVSSNPSLSAGFRDDLAKFVRFVEQCVDEPDRESIADLGSDHGIRTSGKSDG